MLASPLIIPILAITYIGFIYPFYDILCTHITGTPLPLLYIFKVWIASQDWSFLGAIGTISGVGIALFKDSFSKWFNSPELSITCEKENPYTSYNLQNGNYYAMYLRLQVENCGNSIAKNVAIRVKNIKGKDGKGIDISRKIDMYIKPENIGIPQSPFPDIPSGGGMYWDIGIIADPAHTKYNQIHSLDKPVLRIPITYPLANEYHILESGIYDIDIHIVGDKIKRIKKTIKIDTSQLMQWPIINNAIPEVNKKAKEEAEILNNIAIKVLS